MRDKSEQSKLDDLELVAKRMLSSRINPFQIEDPEIGKKREASRLEKQATELMNRFNNGYKALIKEIKQRAVGVTFSATEALSPIFVSQFKMKNNIKELARDLNTWKKQLTKPKKLQTHFGYSKNVLLNFYEIATNFLNQKNYEDAINSFTFLSMLNPAVSSFWIGEGLSFEAAARYTKAIESFENALKAEPSEFAPFWGMIRCSQNLKDYNKVIDLLKAKVSNPALEEEVKEALEYIKNLQKQGEVSHAS